MTAAEKDARKTELVELAMELIAKHGSQIGKADLAAEMRSLAE